MTAKNHRLAKIEKYLTPQQVVVAYLAEIMGQFQSFGDWIEWTVESRDRAPLIRTEEAAAESARKAAKDRTQEGLYKAEMEAARGAGFLVRLFLKVTERVFEKVKLHGLEVRVCAGMLAHLLHTMPDWRRAADANDEELAAWKADMANVRSDLREALGRLHALKRTAEAIQDNYFAGQPVLFRKEAKLLDTAIVRAEDIVDHFQVVAMLGTERLHDLEADAEQPDTPAQPQDDLFIDRGEVYRDFTPTVRAEASMLVTMAKAETLVAMGWQEEGCQLAIDAWRREFKRRTKAAGVARCP